MSNTFPDRVRQLAATYLAETQTAIRFPIMVYPAMPVNGEAEAASPRPRRDRQDLRRRELFLNEKSRRYNSRCFRAYARLLRTFSSSMASCSFRSRPLMRGNVCLRLRTVVSVRARSRPDAVAVAQYLSVRHGTRSGLGGKKEKRKKVKRKKVSGTF